MIILHSRHDKTSRDFILKYDTGHIVYDYEDSIDKYDNICGFPSVIINIPPYYKESETFTDPETGEEIISEGYNVEEHIEIIFNPDDMESMIKLQSYYDTLAITSPYKE